MSERIHQPNAPHFQLRSEYDPERSKALFDLSVEGFEDVLSHREGVANYSASINVARRELSIIYVRDEQTYYEDGLSLPDTIEYQLRRQPLVVELDLKIENYRSGLLRQLAQLSIKEFIDVSPAPFFTEFTLESYKGGGTQALLTTNNIIEGEGRDSHPMSFYDYKNLLYQLEETAEIIQHVAVATEFDKTRGSP